MPIASAICTVAAGLINTLNIGNPHDKRIGCQAVGDKSIDSLASRSLLTFRTNRGRPGVPGSHYYCVSNFSTCISLIRDGIYTFFSENHRRHLPQCCTSNIRQSSTSKPSIIRTGLRPSSRLTTGAAELRSTLTPEQLPGMCRAYIIGLKDGFILGIPMAGIACFVAFATLFMHYRALYRLKKGEANAELGEKVELLEACTAEMRRPKKADHNRISFTHWLKFPDLAPLKKSHVGVKFS